MSIAEQAAGIGGLADPVRRELYELVSAQPDPISRESAAEALGLPAHVVRFQLDRLVALGLLEVEFRRLSGRTGPGAGRPSKLYRRAAETISVSLPERRFDLAGHLLARAIERSGDGSPVADALRDVAFEEGVEFGVSSRAAAIPEASEPAAEGEDPVPAQAELGALGRALAGQGYEPRESDDVLLLANCPFDALARAHTDLVCGMNHAYVEGVVEGLGCQALDAELLPADGRCCVVVHAQAMREDPPVR
ncbi:helix-turn-helix transcriptional regulator [Microbacterium sp. ASV81]|uniref:Transcriptional regulator n=1 Tax=Microbacterium capsulatum TaxID=3041921 RepID=A0ABU0XKL8_9MICO|nr:helix-turn-helix domain-containing protein [Microbacterium sp. ASV81]MDQ4215668.1 transcriptional regulator [Microbacterium sp. ASV81]